MQYYFTITHKIITISWRNIKLDLSIEYQIQSFLYCVFIKLTFDIKNIEFDNLLFI